MRVEIWSDIACPWCYVGKARFEKALRDFPYRDDVEVVHRSFELDPGRAKGDIQPVITMLTKKYGMSAAQAEAGEDNLGAQAAAEGLDYRTRGRDHGSTFDMHRLLHFAKEQGRQEQLLDLLYRANFAEERSVFDDDERLVELAAAAGLETAPTRRRTPTTCAPTSGRPRSSARAVCRSSCSTASTASPAPSPPRSSPRP
jgi:predicted DsbA family dithiol-disulfide isomerase